jgi:hypothetical protein
VWHTGHDDHQSDEPLELARTRKPSNASTIFT